MLPMGWNQIRQARVSDIQQHNNMSYGQPRHPQLMQQNQQFGMYQQPMMQQHQSFPPQMMGNYGMQDPQLMLGNPPKPPEPEGPPPPSPPAPLPSGEAIPPPPPDDGQWWIAEMKNLPSNQHRHVLERMVGEKWFQTMTTGQQIECWQHKLQLLNKQKKESGGNHNMQKPAVVAAPTVSAPSRLNEQEQPPIQSGNIDQDLQKAREEETKVKQQVLTFEKQYGEWKKQFDDWKDKHKNHPNKQQFVQYETQWMTWQKQMSTQKSDYDNSLRTIQERIQNLERQKSGGQSSNEFSGGQRGPPPGQALSNQQLDRFPANQGRLQELSNQQPNRFPGNQGRPQELSNQQPNRFPGNQGGPQEFSNQQPNRFPGNQGGPPSRQGLPNQQLNRFPGNEGQNFNQRPQFRPGFNTGQHPRFDGDQNQGQRFQHPHFNDDNQPAGFTQRPRFGAPGGMDNNSFQYRPPGAFNENQGPRQRFGGPRGGGPRFGEGWQGRGPRPRGPFGPRFRNKLPSLMDEEQDYNDDWGEEEQEENYDEENFQQDFFGRNQGMRGPRPGFGPRGGQRGRFPGPRNRPPRPGGPGESMLFRGPRPRFPNSGPRGRFPGPRGPRPLFGGHGNFGEDFADDFSRDDNFYNEEEETNEQENEGTKDPNTSNKGKGANARDEWNVSRDMVPLSFGVDRRKRRQNRLDTFTFIDAHKQNTDDQEDESEEFDGKEEDVSEENKQKEDTQDIDPENDYSHYMMDVLEAKHKPAPARGRGLPLRRGRGRGDNLPLRGRGRGHPDRGWGRGRDFADDFPFEDVAKPPHLLMQEEGRFSAEKMRRFGDYHDLLGDFPQNRDVPKKETPPPGLKDTTPPTASSSQNTPTTSSSSAPIDTKAIMQKAKELSNLDIKNLLSAVKSIKSTSQQEETGASGSDMDSEKEKKSQMSSISGIDNTDEEAAIIARERHYEQLARGFDEPGPRRKEKDQLSGDGRLTEADLIAAGLDPVSLGLRDEDLLLQEYLLNPSMRDRFLDPVARDPLLDTVARDPLLDPAARDPYFDPMARDPLIDPVSRDPLLDPLLQDSYLERQLLLREIQEMRQREEARHRQEAKRAEELREALTKPILQAQKIVETIDYSHGLKDSDKKKEEDRDGDKRRTSPPPQRDGFRSSPQRDLPFRGRPYPDFENDRHRFPPISMDERMRMREREMFPPGMDERMARERGFFPRNPMEERMMRERGMWPPRSSPPPRRRSPYDPSSSVVVTEDVGEALDKHWEMLERDRESMERKRHSMERRRNSLERRGSSRERVEERHNRERSLERLRKMEWDLKERERMLNERERRLKTPPKKARDNRDRSSWKPEGASSRRSRTPPRRRFEEERSSRDRRFRSRSRSPSPRRGRGRSPMFNRRDRSPRRSPIRGRGGDRRRFSSPSGDPSRTRSPRPPPRKTMKIEPVCVRVEDLLNEPARQLRPKRIVIILRGLPGSGKSHIAKLIRDKESTKGVTPRLLGLDDYFMVENEKFEKDSDTGKIVKRKVHEYEYEAAMEPKYRESLLKSFKKTLEDGYFNFVIVDAINDKVSHFSEFWTTAKKSVFEVYVAEITADAHVCAKRNTHKRALSEIQDLSNKWEETPAHMIRLDVRQMLQDSEIQEVEMGDVSDDEDIGDSKKEKLTPEQLAGIPQSKWELMEANVRLDKLDGIKKKTLTSSHQDMAEFLSVTDDYVQRSSAPGKKRVRWADIQERSAQQRLREVGFVVGQTDWNRLVDGSSHANAALNRTKFI